MSHYTSRPLATSYIQRKHTLNLKQALAENFFSCCEILHFFFKHSSPPHKSVIVSCGNSLMKSPRDMEANLVIFFLSVETVKRD